MCYFLRLNLLQIGSTLLNSLSQILKILILFSQRYTSLNVSKSFSVALPLAMAHNILTWSLSTSNFSNNEIFTCSENLHLWGKNHSTMQIVSPILSPGIIRVTWIGLLLACVKQNVFPHILGSGMSTLYQKASLMEKKSQEGKERGKKGKRGSNLNGLKYVFQANYCPFSLRSTALCETRTGPGASSDDLRLQQQPTLAGPAPGPLTTCPARSIKEAPFDHYLWEASAFTSTRIRVNPSGCICIHLSVSLRLSLFINWKRVRTFLPPQFSFEDFKYMQVNKCTKKKRESGKLQFQHSTEPMSAVFVCIKLVMTFQVSLRLKCLLDHFELSRPVPCDPPDIKRQAFKRTEAPCQGSGVTNSLPWALQ